MKYLIFFLVFTISSTNTCNNKNNKSTTASEKKEQHQSQEKKFFIISLYGKDISDKKLHIAFNEEDNRSFGFSGCNTFSCKYTIKDKEISFGFPMSTKIYCEKEAALEDEFFKAFGAIKTINLEQDSLFLKDSTNTTIVSGIYAKD
ncbi:META domain-containing protein [Aquimarina aquimarini]|uniref:META domain-containing protein n=1 Tax=Aquimarina aquimarini TaxID=1191734 RepID=UPI000D5625C3|nr:META domain-containing protein [Aquimarina aquimarini]